MVFLQNQWQGEEDQEADRDDRAVLEEGQVDLRKDDDQLAVLLKLHKEVHRKEKPNIKERRLKSAVPKEL